MHGYVHECMCSWRPKAGVSGDVSPSMGSGNKTAVLCRGYTVNSPLLRQYTVNSSPLQRQYIVLTLQPHFSVFACLFIETGSQPMLSYLAEGDLELLIFMFSPPNCWEYRYVPLNPGTVAHVNQSILTNSRSFISVVNGTHLCFSTEKMLCKQISSEGPGYKPHNQTHICTLYITYTFISE